MAALLHGAFIQVMQTFLLPVPNVILFQYNPANITHAWSPAPGLAASGAALPIPAPADPLAVSGGPGETFSFSLQMNAEQTIADGNAVTSGLAEATGLYSRLAALEMLMQPDTDGAGGLLGSVSLSIGGASLGGAAATIATRIPSARLPTVLFVWGPGRIVPVRLTSLSITETQYHPTLLHPVQADAAVSLTVLSERELASVHGIMGTLAKGAAGYTHALRQALAIANLANATEALQGLIP